VGPTRPPVQGVPGGLSLGVKRPGREADHSAPAEVKNGRSYTSTAPIRLHGVVLSESTGATLYYVKWDAHDKQRKDLSSRSSGLWQDTNVSEVHAASILSKKWPRWEKNGIDVSFLIHCTHRIRV
jgi:hypothetical protein